MLADPLPLVDMLTELWIEEHSETDDDMLVDNTVHDEGSLSSSHNPLHSVSTLQSATIGALAGS